MAARRTAKQRAASKRNLAKARAKRRRRVAIAFVGGIGGAAAGIAVRKQYRRQRQERFIRSGMRASGPDVGHGFRQFTDKETDILFGRPVGSTARKRKRAARRSKRGR